MKMKLSVVFAALLSMLAMVKLTAQEGKEQKIPDSWIDPSTGHKVVWLVPREGNNMSFYFHNNPFLKSKDGKDDLMVFYGSSAPGNQIFTVNLKSRQIEQITYANRRPRGEITAQKHREVIYQCKDSIFATNIDTKKTRLLFVFPKGNNGTVSTLNADETLLAGTFTDDSAKAKIYGQFPEKKDYFKRIFEAHIPHSLFTINLKTKELKVIKKENEWINHVQFSPKDPKMLMYCHEGTWEKLDRIWTINIKTGETRLRHKRTVENEIAGHEYWSPDGKTIWFDLQRPKSVTFYLAGVDIKTGRETRYSLTRDEWSVHYNISPDQKIFCGDGGDTTSVAKAKDGKWIYLFRPDGDKMLSEKLISMKKHFYRLEPNVHFTPDGKWIVFGLNMFGKPGVFAVETAKAK